MTETEFFEYFEPINLNDLGFHRGQGYAKWGDKMIINLDGEPLKQIDKQTEIAIIGVREDRRSINNKGCSHAPDEIRRCFYPLMPPKTEIKIMDCGNLHIGNEPTDTYIALSEVMSYLLQKKILPIILGGSNDLAIGAYKAYSNLSQIINIFALDAKFDLISDEDPVSDENFLQEIICSEPNYLFDYTHAAYQTYFVDEQALDLLDDLHFERMRLGLMQSNLDRIEPLIRDADMVIVDTNCIRASDAPCSPSPHGLYGEEFCKVINYAGMNDKLSAICFFGDNPINDIALRSSHVVAHALYYFIEGYLWRKHDFPYKGDDNYIKFHVVQQNGNEDVVFYKSKKSDRWWIEVPCTNEMRRKYIRHYIVPCLYEDYQAASMGKMPDRWIIAYNKLNI